MSVLGLDKYNPCLQEFPRASPLETSSDKGLYLTVYPLSRPNTNTVQYSTVQCSFLCTPVNFCGTHGYCPLLSSLIRPQSLRALSVEPGLGDGRIRFNQDVHPIKKGIGLDKC